MSTTLDASTSPAETRQSHDERIQSPPAFLDLADSVRPYILHPFSSSVTPNRFAFIQAARLGGNMQDVTAVGI